MANGFTDDHGQDAVVSITRLIARQQIIEADLSAAGAWLREEIRNETLGGRDAFGNEFAPYSIAYGKARERGGLSSDPVDLYGFSVAHMLDAMEVHVDSGRLEIGFYGGPQEMRARIHNEGAMLHARTTGKKKRKGKTIGRIPRRRFFEATPERIAMMEKIIGDRRMARVEEGG